MQVNTASATAIGSAVSVDISSSDKVLHYNAAATEAVVIDDASATAFTAPASPGTTSGSALAPSGVPLSTNDNGSDIDKALRYNAAASERVVIYEATTAADKVPASSAAGSGSAAPRAPLATNGNDQALRYAATAAHSSALLVYDASVCPTKLPAPPASIADGAFAAAGQILTGINTLREDKAALYAATAAANDTVVVYNARMTPAMPSSALTTELSGAFATTGPPPLTAIDTSRNDKATLCDAAANNKVLLYDAAATPVTSPPIAAFGVDRSPFLGFKPTSPNIEIESVFPETEAAASNGQFVCDDLFPERPADMSVDGGEFLRRGLFPERPAEMSVDGGEFLRHGLFPERPAEMSVDGGEFLRHALFPDSPTHVDQVRLPVPSASTLVNQNLPCQLTVEMASFRALSLVFTAQSCTCTLASATAFLIGTLTCRLSRRTG